MECANVRLIYDQELGVLYIYNESSANVGAPSWFLIISTFPWAFLPSPLNIRSVFDRWESIFNVFTSVWVELWSGWMGGQLEHDDDSLRITNNHTLTYSLLNLSGNNKSLNVVWALANRHQISGSTKLRFLKLTWFVSLLCCWFCHCFHSDITAFTAQL